MCSYSYGCQLPEGFRKIKKISGLLKKLVEENRLKIFCILARQPHCVCELEKDLALSQSLASHHLRDLKDLGLVKSKKKGVRVYYSLTKNGEFLADLIFKILKKEKK
jgi:DNA-binding transcriptional ArsR family regulator